MSEIKDCMRVECDNSQEIVRLLRKMALTDEAKIREFIAEFDPDRRRNYKLFEYVVAHKFGAVLWENIPKLEKTSRDLPIPDKGIDCVSPDFAHAIQAKWHKPGACISFTEAATFFTLGATMKATRLTIVTSEGVLMNGIRIPGVEHLIISNDEFARMLVAALQPPTIVAAPVAAAPVAPASIAAPAPLAAPIAAAPLMTLAAPAAAPATPDVSAKNGVKPIHPRPRVVAPPRRAPLMPPPIIEVRRTVACEKCKEEFQFPSQLKKHQQRKRSCIPQENVNDRAHCKYCSRGFTTATAMYRHMRNSCKAAKDATTNTGEPATAATDQQIKEALEQMTQLLVLLKTTAQPHGHLP
jgi:hypothetical protein